MRRLFAITLLSTTLALSGINAVRAEDGASQQSSSTSEAAATSSNAEDTAINQRAPRGKKHLRASKLAHRSSKRALASKAKKEAKTAQTDNSDSATNSSSDTAKTADAAASDKSEDNKSASETKTADTTSTAESTSTNASSSNNETKTADASHAMGKNRWAMFHKGNTRLAANPATPAGGGSNKGTKHDFGLGTRVASTVVGTVIGTPVAAIRKTMSETVIATKDLVGDTSNPFLLGCGGLLGVPAGILSGAMQAPVVAGWNAWKTSADDPFSSDSFYLGDQK